ncbi:MAG: alkaline phosphatase family protein [Nitrospinota bacterium]|nr:alkaline phosphatase family protein [Nitrospinota bacterium]MDH5588299.1 alkaline phosphatase family protein [Nitrospirota bacterium]
MLKHFMNGVRGRSLMVLVLAMTLIPLAAIAQDKAVTPTKPRLILQITVDQLRGDLPMRYYERLGEGGFRYLWEKGTVYTDAHHAHANTETIVGHATLATGAHPALHGMVGNLWLDRETGNLTYNIEDSRYPLLTKGADVDQQTEIDPTQKAAGTDGRSPMAILGTTFSDELAIHTAGQAKIFGVSVKDRGAVSMAGHAGKAFWFSKKTGEFVTSSYYYKGYPSWVTQWNDKRLPFSYGNTSWELLHEPSSYLFGQADDRPWETNFPGYGRIFPHPFGKPDHKYFTTFLTLSPVGDELTLDFAKALIQGEQLGQDAIPDYLSVSFSSTDYVGHLFGPSSLESEDNILRLDRTLADLLAFVDQHVGLQNTLIVLSSDHGGPEVPGYLNEFGVAANYVNPDTWDKEAGIQRLKQTFGIGKELIQRYSHPYVYLNQSVIQEKGLNQADVERTVAAELVKFEGVALAVSSRALQEGNLPDTSLYRSVLNNFNPTRSGDIFVIFEPHWFINDFDGLTVAATHGSPWTYDTYVPLVFVGQGIPHQNIHRRVHTVALAPTLSSLLNIKAPSGAMGGALQEIFQCNAD